MIYNGNKNICRSGRFKLVRDVRTDTHKSILSHEFEVLTIRKLYGYWYCWYAVFTRFIPFMQIAERTVFRSVRSKWYRLYRTVFVHKLTGNVVWSLSWTWLRVQISFEKKNVRDIIFMDFIFWNILQLDKIYSLRFVTQIQWKFVWDTLADIKFKL